MKDKLLKHKITWANMSCNLVLLEFVYYFKVIGQDDTSSTL